MVLTKRIAATGNEDDICAHGVAHGSALARAADSDWWCAKRMFRYFVAEQVKRTILIGSLSGPYFVIRATKMDHSRTEFTALCF